MIEIKLIDERTGQNDTVSSNLNPVDMVASDWSYLFRAALAIASWDGEQIDHMAPLEQDQVYNGALRFWHKEDTSRQCKKETPAWALDLIRELREIVSFHIQDREKWVKAMGMIEAVCDLLGVEG